MYRGYLALQGQVKFAGARNVGARHRVHLRATAVTDRRYNECTS